MTSCKDTIENKLIESLSPSFFELCDLNDDDSHFSLIIVSEHFKDLNQVARHRLIYKTIGEEMKRSVHALTIKAFTPQEFKA
jgi:BolA family transcriptional regulator, general stress-responsive regulator